jgi:hypothetical protein
MSSGVGNGSGWPRLKSEGKIRKLKMSKNKPKNIGGGGEESNRGKRGVGGEETG